MLWNKAIFADKKTNLVSNGFGYLGENCNNNVIRNTIRIRVSFVFDLSNTGCLTPNVMLIYLLIL